MRDSLLSGFINPFRWKRRVRWAIKSRSLFEIQLLVLDVDGVLTDGGLWFDASGGILKRFDVRDGLGLRLLQREGITIAFLSGGKGGATEARAKQLGIQHCLVGIKNKVMAIETLQKDLNFSSAQTAFLGDDLNDLPLRSKVKFLFATADACIALSDQSDKIIHNSGGHGAVRELAELLLKSRGSWEKLRTEGWIDSND